MRPNIGCDTLKQGSSINFDSEINEKEKSSMSTLDTEKAMKVIEAMNIKQKNAVESSGAQKSWKKLFAEYSKNTTGHGVRYLSHSSRPRR